MEYFVYFEDDYHGNGGVGLASFESQDGALAFIQGRLSDPNTSRKRTIDNYIVVRGERLNLEAVEYVSRVAIKK